MIDRARQYISEILERAQRPALFLSLGKDSLLLLYLIHEIKRDIPLFYFGDTLSEFAQQVIIDHDLTVWGYAPSDRYLVPEGKGIALVDEYDLNGVRIPLVNRIVEGDNCQHRIPEQRRSHFPFYFDYTFTGMKQNETCEAVGITFPKEIDLGVTKIVSPLYEMTDADVYRALDSLNIPYANESDDLELCGGCLSQIENSNWSRDASLRAFRDRFNFH